MVPIVDGSIDGYTDHLVKVLFCRLTVLMEKGTTEEKSAASAVCDHLFQVEEYRDLGVHLLRKFAVRNCFMN